MHAPYEYDFDLRVPASLYCLIGELDKLFGIIVVDLAANSYVEVHPNVEIVHGVVVCQWPRHCIFFLWRGTVLLNFWLMWMRAVSRSSKAGPDSYKRTPMTAA